MRKPKEKYSKKAKAVLAIASQLAISTGSDPSWALAEAIGLETPIGEVHLHWTSHRGHGAWRLTTHSQWRGEICGTLRCRRVIISPLGGENESIPYDAATFDEVQNKWLWTRAGAVCSWPRSRLHSFPGDEDLGYDHSYVYVVD